MLYSPNFYHPLKVGTLYTPDILAVVQAGRQTDFAPAHEDHARIMLLLVDPQVDFIHPDGALSVPGAVEDTQRIIEWILRHTGRITTIATSLDSHIPTQIFFPPWWMDETRQHPAPFTSITSQEVEQGRWQPVFEPQWSVRYVHLLEAQAKKALMIWPYHTLLGTPGHTITPALYEAIAYHSAARLSRPVFLTKGLIARTEHYSLLEPEVKVSDEPGGELNVEFLEMQASYDQIYVAGQAKSHCVLETVSSVMRYFDHQPEKISKWHILTDCMSSVTHPVIDFDTAANRTLAAYAESGLQLIRSSDPLR